MSRCENCIIRQFNALKVLDKEDLKSLSDNKIVKKVKKGETIFEEGEKLNGVFCVRDGVSKLSKLSENGKDQIVKIASKGEILGQRSVVAEESTNLSAVALEDMEMCFIPKKLIAEKINNNPDFTKNLLILMAKELKEADDFIVNMSQKTVKQRLAQALLYLDENFGANKAGFLEVSLSREDLSNVVGTATESCIRLLSELKREGRIETSGKTIKIVDTNGLKAIVDGH